MKKHKGFHTRSCRDVPKARGPLGTVCPSARPAACLHLWSLSWKPPDRESLPVVSTRPWGHLPLLAKHRPSRPRSLSPECVDFDLPGPPWARSGSSAHPWGGRRSRRGNPRGRGETPELRGPLPATHCPSTLPHFHGLKDRIRRCRPLLPGLSVCLAWRTE